MADAALDDTALATAPVRSLPDPEPTARPDDVEGWGARPELRGARGAPTVAVGDNSMPPVTEKMKLPAERYDHLEKENPQLHQIIDKVAGDVGVPAIDLANIAYASSGFKQDTPGGYMNVSPQTAQRLDPDGHFNPQDPVDNVYLGAVKYKELADHFGVSTSSALGAYGMNLETIQQMAGLSPEDQRKHFPQVFDYLRRLSSGITGKQPGMTAVDEPQKQEYQPPLGRPSGEPSQATQDILRDRPTGAAPPPEMQNPPTDMAQVDAAVSPEARRRENLELLGRVADRSNAPLPPVNEMQNPPTDLTQVDQAGQGRQPQLTGRWSNQGGPSVALQSQLRSVREQQNPALDLAAVDQATDAERRRIGVGTELRNPQDPNMTLQRVGQSMTGRDDPSQATRDILQAHENQQDQPDFYARGRPVSSLPTGPEQLRGTPSALDVSGVTDMTVPPTVVPPDAKGALTAALPPPAEMTVPPTVVPPAAPPSAALPGPPPPKPDVPAAWPPPAVAGNPPPGAAALPGAPAAPTATGTSTPPAAPPPGPTPAPGAPAGAPGAPAGAPAQPGQPTAAQLNQDELARIRAGQPPGPPGAPIPNVQTPSGAVAQPVGQGAGPAAPAVGPGRAAGEAPPVTGGANFSMPGLVRAGMQGGPQGFMSNMVATAPRGMSTNDMWASVGNHLQRAFILRGDMVGAQRAAEYVFQMQHAGSNQAMMQAYGALAVGDATGAANLLAKAHAFVPDGSTMAFKVGPPDPRTGQPTLWGQRFVDATGQPVGGPLQVTPQGIAGMLNQTMDPQQFLKTLNTERQTIAKIAHNQNMEAIRNKAIDVGAGTAAAGRQERAREADQVQAGATARAQMVDQRSRELAAAADQRMRDIAAGRKSDVANARRNAITKETEDYYNDPTSDHYQYGGAGMTPDQVPKAQDIHGGLRTYDPDMQPRRAADITKNVVSGQYGVRQTTDGRYAVLNKPGNDGTVIAYLPASAMRAFGRGPGEAPAPAAPAQAAPAAPAQAAPAAPAQAQPRQAPALVPPPPQQRAVAP